MTKMNFQPGLAKVAPIFGQKIEKESLPQARLNSYLCKIPVENDNLASMLHISDD